MGEAGVHVWESEELLADRYEVLECLRQTATGCLYRVDDVFRGSHQLILGPGLQVLQKDGGIEWFERYGERTLGVAPHANLLVCRRLDRHRGVPFLVMNDVEGGFLDTAIEQGRVSGLLLMLDVALQMARGVAWLHEQNRVHYNVKPANAILSDSNVIKVWKYGEVEAVSRPYASPEQLKGGGSLAPATDIWSWAVSVLHIFVGRVVWKSGLKVPTVMRRYVRHGPARPELPPMPGRLADLVRDCLQEDPGARPAGMQEVVREMEPIMKGVQAGVTGPAAAEPDEAAEDFAALFEEPDVADEPGSDVDVQGEPAGGGAELSEDDILEVIQGEEDEQPQEAEEPGPDAEGRSADPEGRAKTGRSSSNRS